MPTRFEADNPWGILLTMALFMLAMTMTVRHWNRASAQRTGRVSERVSSTFLVGYSRSGYMELGKAAAWLTLSICIIHASIWLISR
jgi:hypothetical protein